MTHPIPRLAVVALAAVFAAGPALPVRADLVKLKNGGELRGRIDPKTPAGEGEIVIETLTGATVVVARDHVQFVTRRPLLVEDYESRARRTLNTVEAQWDLAEWCRENNLPTQRNECLERVIALDPDHEKAHYGLGHTKHEGEWISRDELMESQGYVKYRGRYITPQELEILEKSKAQLEAEKEWHGKVRLWLGWLTGRHEERRRQGLEHLQNIDDPNAVTALVRNLQDDSNPQLRRLYIAILKRIPGPRPVPPLVQQSLHDADYELRYESLNAIAPEHYPVAMPLYIRELKNSLNGIVCRAAAALERVGDQSAVPALIEAVTTTHRYKVRVPDQSSTLSFRTDGTFGNGPGQMNLPPELHALVASGQAIIHNPQAPPTRMKTVVINYEHQNAEALSALQKLTGQSYGYDKRNWRLWWTAHKSGTLK